MDNNAVDNVSSYKFQWLSDVGIAYKDHTNGKLQIFNSNFTQEDQHVTPMAELMAEVSKVQPHACFLFQLLI